VAVSDETRQGHELEMGAYCRAIESHLCHKNDGHLIRISGPAFDLVRGWANQGMPLKVVLWGIDRTFERYYRKGPRRRPVHIAFCEADVLDAFDEWRRAIGVVSADVASTLTSASAADATPTFRPSSEEEVTAAPHAAATRRSAGARGASRSDSLPAHIDRVANRLTLLRGEPRNGRDLDDALAQAVLTLDSLRPAARQARGSARQALIARLESIDAELLARAGERLSPDQLSMLRRDASDALAPFRERMPSDAYLAARERALAQLIREHARLPLIRYEFR
jgi:hypothetical protein